MLENHKIISYEDNIKDLPDYPSDAGYTAAQLKAMFDARTDKEIKEKFNALIDELVSQFSKVDGDISTNGEQIERVGGDLAEHRDSEDAHRILFEGLKRELSELITAVSNEVAEHKDDASAHSELFERLNAGLSELIGEALKTLEEHKTSDSAHAELFAEIVKTLEGVYEEIEENYVKTNDYASQEKAGVVKVAQDTLNSAVFVDEDGYIKIIPADKLDIDERNTNLPITPKMLDYAVKSVGDGYYATEEQSEKTVRFTEQTLTEEQKAQARENMGAASNEATYAWGAIPVGDYSSGVGNYKSPNIDHLTADGVGIVAQVPCSPGDKFKINVDNSSLQATPLFVDGANNKRVQRIWSEKNEIQNGDYEFTIEDGGVTLVINYTVNADIPRLWKLVETSLVLQRFDERVTSIENAVENLGDAENIPWYWKDAVTEVEDRITKLQNIGGADTFTFGFVTDTHTTSSANGKFAELMERVLRKCNIPIFLHGGDFISGIGISSKDEHLAEIRNHDYIFRNIEDKMLLAMGNHDPAFGVSANYDSNLTDGEIYNYIFRKNQNKNGIVYGDNGTYFYRDVVAQKARYIVLNCFAFDTELDENGLVVSNNKMRNTKLGTTQLSWLADTALDVPEGYSIVLCSHIPPYREADRNAIGWTGENSILDCDVALGIVNACRNKATYSYNGTIGSGTMAEEYSISADFTQNQGNVVCWVAGHTHKDYIFNLDGLAVVSTANCSSHQSANPVGFAPTKTAGTDTEYVMDFVCVNKRTRACNVVRLGAALNSDADGRSFNY